MTFPIVGLVTAITLLWLGEKLPNQTKEVYTEKGHNWKTMLIWSNITAVFLGALSVYLVTSKQLPNYTATLPFAVAITSYISVQSLFTDLRTTLINRNILRVAYLSMYVLALYNIFTNSPLRENLAALISFTVLLIVLFIFSPIGASDIRAIAVGLPFSLSIGGYFSLYLLLVSLIAAAIFVAIRREREVLKELKRRKEQNPQQLKEYGIVLYNKVTTSLIRKEIKPEIPVGPFMIIPFALFLLTYPL